jgi:hypothetical protein
MKNLSWKQKDFGPTQRTGLIIVFLNRKQAVATLATKFRREAPFDLTCFLAFSSHAPNWCPTWNTIHQWNRLFNTDPTIFE